MINTGVVSMMRMVKYELFLSKDEHNNINVGIYTVRRVDWSRVDERVLDETLFWLKEWRTVASGVISGAAITIRRKVSKEITLVNGEWDRVKLLQGIETCCSWVDIVVIIREYDLMISQSSLEHNDSISCWGISLAYYLLQWFCAKNVVSVNVNLINDDPS